MKRTGGGDPDAAGIAAAARAWLAESKATLDAATTPGAALTIRSPSGAPDGWWVPLLAGDRLVGYLRFTAGGERRGLSSFAQPHPLAADWLDAQRITACARTHAEPDAIASTPVLSYDGSPERLAWRVVFSASNGRRFAVCVAGTSAWRCADAL